MRNTAIFLLLLFHITSATAQDLSPSIGLYTGFMNYEGDLKPNSFTFSRSHPFVSVFFKQPLNHWLIWRTGIMKGSLEAADRDNRSYLQSRNLSFHTGLVEGYTGMEFHFINFEKNRFTPYGFIGAAVFHFNPWTIDAQGNKVYLQPLSTEGQGLAVYPDRKPYRLTQYALSYAGGIKYRVNDHVIAGLEFNQRKTFTDYLDDVSSSFVDYNTLKAAKGQQAVDLAYRGDELPGGSPYPHYGEQRGTPTEKDWYYFIGISAEVKLNSVRNGLNKLVHGKNSWYYQRCPTLF